MERRHPHVFGDVAIADADAQTVAWETHKAGERAAKVAGAKVAAAEAAGAKADTSVLADFLAHLVEHGAGFRPVEAGAGGALAELLGAEEGG